MIPRISLVKPVNPLELFSNLLNPVTNTSYKSLDLGFLKPHQETEISIGF